MLCSLAYVGAGGGGDVGGAGPVCALGVAGCVACVSVGA